MPPEQDKPWYQKGLRFQCTGSGNCCRNHGDYAYVNLTEEEIQRIAAYLGLERSEFLERWCVKDLGYLPVLRMDRPACPFLDRKARCSIYPVRPRQCAAWPFWRENLLEEVWDGPVRECCPGIGRGPLHPAEEIDRVADDLERHLGGN